MSRTLLREEAPKTPAPGGRSGVPWHRGIRAWVRPPRPLARGAAVLIALIAVVAAGLGAYVQRAVVDTTLTSYELPVATAKWVQTERPGPIGWFRTRPVLAETPVAASLVVEARDSYRVWVNSTVVASNRADARLGRRLRAAVLDVRAYLRPGLNSVAVVAAGLGEKTAAVWLRLDLTFRNGTTRRIATGGPGWSATADAALTGTRLGAQPAFSTPSFSTNGWATPHAVPSIGPIVATVPSAVVTASERPAALSAATAPGSDVVFRAAFDAGGASRDTWLRVAATGAATVSDPSGVVATLPAPGYVSPRSPRPAQLWVVHLRNGLPSGQAVVTLHVVTDRAATVALDVFVRSGPRWRHIPSAGVRWTAAISGGPERAVAADPFAGARSWPHGFLQQLAHSQSGSVPWRASVLGGLAGLVAACCVVLAVRTRRASRTGSEPVEAPSERSALGRLLMVLAPPAALIVAALALGRWVVAAPRFAYRPAVAVSALVVAACVPALWLLARAVRDRRAGRQAPQWWRRAVALDRVTVQRVAVVLLGVTGTVAAGWRLNRQPLWQDEATSVAVARAIRDHGLPRLASGLYYFKAELYHALLAVVLGFSDSTTVLRAVSLVWFAACVLAFGLLLMPVLTARPGLVVAATALFIVLPQNLVWARDIRMYQQMQFFVIVFVAMLLRALRDGRRRDIVLSAVFMVAMYLSHEESFVLLPAVPILALVARRTVWRRRRVFAAAYAPALLVIGAQYLLTAVHPVAFGEDLSNRPYVGWDPHQADYYLVHVFFAPLQQRSLAIVSTLALLGFALSIRRRAVEPALAGVVMCVSVITASVVFTAKADRYGFVALPMVIALAVLGADALVKGIVRLCTAPGAADGARTRPSTWTRAGAALTAGLLAVATLFTTALAPQDYGLWLADTTGQSGPLTHLDYQPTVAYLRAHLRPGDQVITLSPPVMTDRYLGRPPDRVIQTGRNKLLYLVLRGRTAVETLLGRPVVLTGPALRTFLEAHHRVWLVSDIGSYLQGVPPDLRTEITSDFHVVFQDATTTLSLWDSGS